MKSKRYGKEEGGKKKIKKIKKLGNKKVSPEESKYQNINIKRYKNRKILNELTRNLNIKQVINKIANKHVYLEKEILNVKAYKKI